MTDSSNGAGKAGEKSIHHQADSDGGFRPQSSLFRGFVSADQSSEFPAEKDRYVLLLSPGCPWAHRTNIVRSLKGLEDIVQLSILGGMIDKSWAYTGDPGTDKEDPCYGFKYLRDLYYKADPGYNARFTVPALWDKKKETIVSNESSEIIRMFYSEFDGLLPAGMREVSKPGGGLFPSALRQAIEDMNSWVFDTVNIGVYKTGLATTQQAYEEHLYALFHSLDRLEQHLSQSGHQPYIFGENITEADIRLFTTLIRFDVAYCPIFLCNLKMIRHDYPRLHDWLRLLYWDESSRTNGGAFKKTTYFDFIKHGYAYLKQFKVVPAGPEPHILALNS